MDPTYVLIWPGRAVYVGPLLTNDAHAHHAIQISVALGEPLSLQVPPDRQWRSYGAVATASDLTHRVRCRGPLAQIYLDPESAAGLRVRQDMREAPVHPVAVDHLETLVAALHAGPDGRPDVARLTGVVDALTGTGRPDLTRDLIDPRVQRALTFVHGISGRHIPIRAPADRVALSPSRLGELFRRDIGIPLRRYLLWLRLIDAVEELAGGVTLTEAAHRAGFADSAHFTRTFNVMFGMPPSALHLAHVEILDLAAGSVARPWWAAQPE